METPKTQTLNLNDAERFCLGLSMLAKECNMSCIKYCEYGVKTFHFSDGSSVGGLMAYIEAGLITKI